MRAFLAGEKPFIELSHKNLANDSNLVIDSIHRAVWRAQRSRIKAGVKLPSVLYLQLDNCRANKSKVMFAYASYLVMKGVFDKVRLCFCLVGHTHENIDQFFSR
jgi:hypothetical protein